MKVKSIKLRAAIQFQAKNDVRHYLNGINISKDYIEATNGHIAVRMNNCESFNDEGFIIKFIGSIPKKADTTEILKNERVCKHYDCDGSLIGAQAFDILEGAYPDLSKVVPKTKKKDEFPPLQTKYLNVIDKAFNQASNKFCTVKPVSYALNEAVVFTVTQSALKDEFGCPIILIMPSRD